LDGSESTTYKIPLAQGWSVGHGAFLLKRQGRRGKGKEGRREEGKKGCARNEMRLVQPSSFLPYTASHVTLIIVTTRHSTTAISSLLPLLSPFPSFPPLLSSSTNKTSNDDNRANPSHYNPPFNPLLPLPPTLSAFLALSTYPTLPVQVYPVVFLLPHTIQSLCPDILTKVSECTTPVLP